MRYRIKRSRSIAVYLVAIVLVSWSALQEHHRNGDKRRVEALATRNCRNVKLVSGIVSKLLMQAESADPDRDAPLHKAYYHPAVENLDHIAHHACDNP